MEQRLCFYAQKTEKDSGEYAQDPDLSVFPRHLFFQKNRNSMEMRYQLYVAAFRTKNTGSKHDCLYKEY